MKYLHDYLILLHNSHSDVMWFEDECFSLKLSLNLSRFI